MSLPFMLQRFGTYIDGETYIGETEEVELPKLSRIMEAIRTGGMAGPVEVDLGNEKMEASINFGGAVRRALNTYAIGTVDGVQLRWVGAYKSGNLPQPMAVECTMRGQFTEIDFGTAKAGEKSQQKQKYAVSYYKLVIDGATVIEIDQLRGVTIVNGVDRDATLRAIIGA